MKTNRTLAGWLMLAALFTLNLQPSTVHAQGTAFTYQGRLNDGGSPATGLYDLEFVVYDALYGGNPVAVPLTNSATGVTNGLFTVTLDFGSGVFTGPARWLQIVCATNGTARSSPWPRASPSSRCPMPSWPTAPATCSARCPPRN